MAASVCAPAAREWFYAGAHAGVAEVKLSYAIEQNLEAAVVVGGPGAGKTILMRRVATQVAAAGDVVVDVYFPQLDVDGLLAFVDAELAGHTRSAGVREVIRRELRLRRIADRTRRLADERRGIVLLIDDAHLIHDDAVFEALQLLLNLRERENARLTIVLAGQKTLLTRLGGVPAFAQRIGVTATLAPLDVAETTDYVRQRLQRDARAIDEFEDAALAAIHDHSEGIPRRIDRLCEMAMLMASLNGSRQVTASDIRLVAAERGLLDSGPH